MPKGSILVVDDEAEIREGLELLLESEGYAVATAETGEAGLARLEEQPFDLLLLDVSLPDRNGTRSAARNPPAGPHASGGTDHRVRLDRHGAPGVQERRAGLHHQAVVE